MIRKFIIAASLAGALLMPATASASKRGANEAVKHQMIVDYGYSDVNTASVYCRTKQRNLRYSCFISVPVTYSDGGLVFGNAKVTQRGNRYSVTYRIYW